MLWAWGWREGWTSRWAVAPLLTLGLFGGAAIVLEGRVRWDVWTALGVLALVTLPAALVRRRRPRPEPSAARVGAPRVLGVVVAAALLTQLLAVATGLGRPGRLLTAFDVTFHLNGVEYIRETGSGSSFDLTALYSLTNTPDHAFYGAAWHDVAALLPRLSDASTTFTLALVVPALLAWTTGIVYLTRTVFPARPRAWVWSAALSVAGLGLPLYLGLSAQGLVANAVGVALVPAMVALVPATDRLAVGLRVPLLLLAVVGVGLCHPNAVLGAALVLAPWVVGRLANGVRRGWLPGHRAELIAACVVGLAVPVSAWLMMRTGSYARVSGVSSTEADAPLPLGVALLQVAGGNGTGEGLAAGFVVAAGAVAGAVLARRLPRARWALWGCGVAVVWYLLSTSSVAALENIDAAWYGEPHRFAPVVAATMVPPAALALDSAWRQLRLLVARAGQRPALALALSVALVGVSCAEAAVGTNQLVRHAYRNSDGRGLVADDDELAMMHRLPDELGRRGAIFGSPFSGAAHLYALDGLPVVPRSWHTVTTPEMRYVSSSLARLGSDPKLCDALDALDVNYLYVDPDAWNHRDSVIDVPVPPPSGVRLVDTSGSASVYEITACG